MKTIYRVSYRGLWMGGTAVVAADSKEEAIMLAESDSATVGFTHVTVETLPELTESRVLFNDNGNY